MALEIRLEVALGKNKGCETQMGKKLSGMIEMFFILTSMVITQVSSFVKTIHIKYVHLIVCKFITQKLSYTGK